MTRPSRARGALAPLRAVRAAVRTLANQFGVNVRWIRGVKSLLLFAAEYRRFRTLNHGSRFELCGGDICPALTDRVSATPIEPIYFLQDTWCAGKISEVQPESHVDVGSSIRAMALVAQFVPVTFVDIRRVDIEVRNVTYKQGSVLQLPFSDRSVASLSSLCVIEHIGLGRYGDPLDAWGSERAAAELARVLAVGGNLYLSVPVDDSCRIYFNAHRAFTRDYICSLFSDLRLIEERYIYGRSLSGDYRASAGFGTGLYHFKRQ